MTRGLFVIAKTIVVFSGLAHGQEPTNDDFVDKIDLGNVLPVLASGSNEGATRETGETVPSGTVGSGSIWWTWQAPADGTYQLEVIGSGFTPAFAVYTGPGLVDLTPVADNTKGDTRFDATAGVQYHVQVLGFFSGAGPGAGPVSLRISTPPVFVFSLSSNLVFSEAQFGLSGTISTNVIDTPILDMSDLVSWNITVRTPDGNDGIASQILTELNSTVEFERNSSVGFLRATEDQMLINGRQSGDEDPSALTFSIGDVSLSFRNGTLDFLPSIKIEDASEVPSSALVEFAGNDNNDIVVGTILPKIAIPMITIRQSENPDQLEVDFTGILQVSEDLSHWQDLDPQPTSPYSISTGDGRIFLRSRAP